MKIVEESFAEEIGPFVEELLQVAGIVENAAGRFDLVSSPGDN